MKRLAILSMVILAAFFSALVLVGNIVVQPFQTSVAPPPAELGAKSVVFSSASGATLHGWLAAGTPGNGVVVLLHGIRANRHAMLERALVLHRNGFGVLLFDFQAHGESIGRHITFGYLEGLDAESAVHYARQVLPGERIGVIGLSLGGAAALLAPKPLLVDAMVLESVYSTIHLAFTNRLRARLGPTAGAILVPLISPPFELLMPMVIGVGPGDLRPIDRIGLVQAPLLVASGTMDAYTTIAEAKALFDRALAPKQFWPVDGAAHVDFERYNPAEYWARVLPFLITNLRRS